MNVADQKQRNRYLDHTVSETVFEQMRSERDSQLQQPKLLHPSLQINIRGGRLPLESAEGFRAITLPLRLKDVRW